MTMVARYEDLQTAFHIVGLGSPFVDVGTGRLAPRFVTSSDVRDLKIRLNPSVEALDKLVADCPEMPAVLVAGWNAFSVSWKVFLQTPEGFWTAGAEMDQAEAYQADIQSWNEKLTKAPCKGGAPSPYAPPPPSTEGKTPPEVAAWIDAAKVAAVSAAVIGVAIVGIVYAPEVKAFFATKRAAALRSRTA
jgi:hypothetical protein